MSTKPEQSPASENGPAEPKGWPRLRKQLHHEARASLCRENTTLIRLGLYKHSIITPVLRQLAYDPNLTGQLLRSIFEDGSQPSPFPCGLLANRSFVTEPEAKRVSSKEFHLGLMSLRHPEMDYLVDFYIIRNRDIYVHDSTAEVEEFAFNESLKLLTDPSLDDGGLINLYHTGLEPVIIGFYRALVTVLLWRDQKGNPNPLIVRPCIYVGHDKSEKFSANSPGANPDNYIHSMKWW